MLNNGLSGQSREKSFKNKDSRLLKEMALLHKNGWPCFVRISGLV